ncbi:MAG: methyltransferase domain-containing protein [Planctomycetota bacterium]
MKTEHTTPSKTPASSATLEQAVRSRYAQGAQTFEPELCCPTVHYDSTFLKQLPREIIEKDYGCGDPSKHVKEGETVLDLGSGAGKICYILSHKVGPKGRILGLDFNDPMLALARKYKDQMAKILGYANVEFHKARIQDMALDVEAAEAWLQNRPVTSLESLAAFEGHCQELRTTHPLVADASVDVIVSNCVLNLVRTEEKTRLFHEMHRVLKRGGRAVISDIVCDEDPTPGILNDPHLWSGCIAGAFREDRFLEMFEEAGFYGVKILERAEKPWHTIEGVEFRSLTVSAFKGKEGPCLERHQAVVYKGPWKEVRDDDGHSFKRGERMAVCDKTYQIMTSASGPYAGEMNAVPPSEDVPLEKAKNFECQRAALRHPRETKGVDYRATFKPDSDSCGAPDSKCC